MLPSEEVLRATRERLTFDVAATRAIVRDKRPIDVNPPERITAWIESNAGSSGPSDALERILGGNDLMNINYLDRGAIAAKAVGRVVVRNAAGDVEGFGTGFLISPRLLLTNNHVLPNRATAATSSVEMNYQYDADGRKTAEEEFAFDVEACFVTDARLDYTVVAVQPATGNGRGLLAKYGFLKLNPTPGKTLDAQYLTIIQHPSGQRKQIALRENQLIKTTPDFLWYATDTNPGASGSCVFNDQWQVVALHHSGVDARDAQGRPLAIDGSLWDPSKGEEKRKWIANEGVRISSIVTALEAFASIPLVAEFLASAGNAEVVKPRETNIVYQTAGAGVAPVAVAFEKISIDPNYDNRHGYDPAFLGTGEKRVALPKLSEALLAIAAKKKEDDGRAPHVLTYHHYSVAMNAERKLAFYTAVNIDGAASKRLKREKDFWIPDPRIESGLQTDDALYAGNDFDRGHLVRRLDPAWGDAAKVANDDTFHFTNCSPQHKDFNQGKNLWAGLEDYILDNADNRDLKATVFTGPVFASDDEQYRGVKIPKQFWKVVAMVRANGRLSASAYLVSQATLIRDVEEADFRFGRYRTFQVPIRRIESLTGLSFGRLRDFDALPVQDGVNEATSPAQRVLSRYDQIVL